MLAVATFPRGLVTILTDKATLSQRLHTPPLPATHALVGYRMAVHWVVSWKSQSQQLFKRLRVALVQKLHLNGWPKVKGLERTASNQSIT